MQIDRLIARKEFSVNFKVVSKGLGQLAVKRLAGPFWVRRRWLNKTQWLDKEHMQQIQLKLLKRIVAHSYNTVPYYRKLMDKYGIRPDSIKRLDDIKLFPVLTKTDVLKAKGAGGPRITVSMRAKLA